MQKTTQLKKEEIERDWHKIDLSGETLGRISTKIAKLLIGKHKPSYTPHLDCGDYVVAVNAEDVQVSGKKLNDKLYHRHSGYMGGLKTVNLKELMEKNPAEVIKLAVKNMLPKNKLRSQRIKRLKVFKSEEHPYAEKFQ